MNISDQQLEISIKNKVRFGRGLSIKLPEIIRELGFDRVGFVIDGNLYDKLKIIQKIVYDCKSSFSSVIVHEYREKFEPTYQFLDHVKTEFKKNDKPLVDCMVGIGGGSVIDSAKGVAVLATNHDPALNYKGFPLNINRPLPVIAVPSTAGTGTELVYNASFIDAVSKVKMGINDINNYPILAILDPDIVSSAPKAVAISSGCDALVHTLESFVSVKSNELTRLFSNKAFGLIINTLPKLINDMGNLEYWSKMQWGAYLAMVALSNTSSGPAGALSYYLGANYNVPHGIAGAVFIGNVTRLNHKLGYYGYAELYSQLESYDPSIADKEAQSRQVVNAIETSLEDLGIPNNLNEMGVKKEDFASFFTFATETAKGAFEFNPVEYDKETVSEMLNELIGI